MAWVQIHWQIQLHLRLIQAHKIGATNERRFVLRQNKRTNTHYWHF